MKFGRCPVVPSLHAAAGWDLEPNRDGVALVLVLTFLVLIAALVVAFFTTVTTELAGSKSYASGVTARQLADSAIHISMGTVGQATAATKPGDATSPLIWASQPGMIRTYDDTGAPYAYYKLYSSDNTVVSNPSTNFSPGDFKPNWSAQPALYTDLNAPAIVNGTATRYPIVDPRAATGSDAAKGFSIDSTAPVDNAATMPNPAPMPVQWIYVLNDGTMTTPTSVDGTGKIASWSGSSNAPTTTNPIVGRVAYWTDDDTCKININTAAGDVWTDSANFPAAGNAGNPGAFWDAPRTSATFERTYLGQNQPAQHEFQRYPGHPATTYLSTVFPTLTTDNLYQIAPRVVKGGSVSGTQSTSSAASALTPDSDRLYASVDELLFSTTRADPAKRDTNPVIIDSTLNPKRFFLTARSRAPEINLFNQPRIAAWPVSSLNDATHRTPYDSLIAFCATLNNNVSSTPYPYYFQRATAASQTADLPANATADGVGRNRALITYLRGLTSKPIPGFGGSFLTKYPKDRDQILTEIFDYIRALNAQDVSMRATVPGFVSYTPVLSDLNAHGGVVAEGQILPIIDTSHSDSNSKTLRGFGRFPTVREASIMLVGVGQTVGTKTSVVTGQPAILDGKTRVKAVFILNFFDPSQGFAISIPDFYVRINGLNSLALGGINMGYASSLPTFHVSRIANGGAYGGYIGDSTFITAGVSSIVSPANMDLPTNSPNGVAFSGGTVTVDILDSAAGTNVLQTLTVPFPADTAMPLPLLAPLLQDPTPALNSDYRVLTAVAPSGGIPAGRFYGACGTNTSWSTWSKSWVCGRDVIRSVEANTDYRTIAALASVDGSYFTPMVDYFGTANLVHGITEAENGAGLYPSYNNSSGSTTALVPGASYGSSALLDLVYGGFVPQSDGTPGLQVYAAPPATPGGGRPGGLAPSVFGLNGQNSVPANGVYAGTNGTGSGAASNPPGDWDTGLSIIADGPFINKADEGTNTGNPPYYQNLAVYESVGSGLFSPNRMMPSAGMFGSLPTGVFANRPWQTLLFRPDPGGHLGAQTPPDYLLLDLFNMPVVEPYPISDPFSTAGKINMNYQIVPFTYVTRSTAIQAVLKAEQPLAIPTNDSSTYKSQSANYANHRLPLDLGDGVSSPVTQGTLVGFQNRFNNKDIFRSASEICSIWLVPQGSTYAGMPSFWSSNLLTGDNVRERPYADIYPRLTTQSNTYTVHYRVQSLRPIPNGTAGTWTEGKDSITAEYRGSSTFERYLDTGDTTIPDYATAPNPKTIDNFYKFRVIETKQFTP